MVFCFLFAGACLAAAAVTPRATHHASPAAHVTRHES